MRQRPPTKPTPPRRNADVANPQSGRSERTRVVPADAQRDEQRIHGLNAALAAFAARPQDLRKAWLLESRLPALRDLLAWCVSRRIGYRVVDEDELARLVGSRHHEGVCLAMNPRPQPDLPTLLRRLADAPVQRLLWLDGVGNPHNLGAVLRSAAHFGAAAVLLPGDSPLTLSGAAVRVAEGGAEAVDLVRVDADAVAQLAAAGFELIATLPTGAESVFDSALPARCVICLGAEGDGMAAPMIASCSRSIGIPGSGRVESLNIANAAAVLLAEHWRQHRSA